MNLSAHWDRIYQTRDTTSVSWYQPTPTSSLDRIQRHAALSDAILDVGAGASFLADNLVDSGFSDVTVLDISAAALGLVRDRVPAASFVTADLLGWQPPRRFDLWHDRAVFHFLRDPADQQRYQDTLLQALEPGGVAVISAFHVDGPQRCSDLPTAQHDADSLFAAVGGAARFSLLEQAVDDHVTPKGIVQRFQSVVLRRH